MKLKNITKSIKQLRILGQIVEVQPGKIIEIESTKVIYDNVVFKLIEIQKRKEKVEEPIKQEEVKKNDTSNRTRCMDRDILNYD